MNIEHSCAAFPSNPSMSLVSMMAVCLEAGCDGMGALMASVVLWSDCCQAGCEGAVNFVADITVDMPFAPEPDQPLNAAVTTIVCENREIMECMAEHPVAW